MKAKRSRYVLEILTCMKDLYIYIHGDNGDKPDGVCHATIFLWTMSSDTKGEIYVYRTWLYHVMHCFYLLFLFWFSFFFVYFFFLGGGKDFILGGGWDGVVGRGQSQSANRSEEKGDTRTCILEVLMCRDFYMSNRDRHDNDKTSSWDMLEIC